MFDTLGRSKISRRAAKMLIGIPDCDNYVEHAKTNHPDKPYMTYEDFFRERRKHVTAAMAKAVCAVVNGDYDPRLQLPYLPVFLVPAKPPYYAIFSTRTTWF